jgi:hypothetical protein
MVDALSNWLDSFQCDWFLVFLAQEFDLLLDVGTFLLLYTVRSLKLATLFIAGSRIMLSVSLFSFFLYYLTHRRIAVLLAS